MTANARMLGRSGHTDYFRKQRLAHWLRRTADHLDPPTPSIVSQPAEFIGIDDVARAAEYAARRYGTQNLSGWMY